MAFFSVTVLGACATDGGETLGAAGAPAQGARLLAESPAAGARLADLRERFVGSTSTGGAQTPPAPLLRAGVARGFERTESGRVRPLVDPPAGPSTARVARVELPARASGAVHLEDASSQLAVDFALDGAQDAELVVADGLALYRSALPGADVVHRPHAEGTEDYVVFEQQPDREELVYRVDVSQAFGLRLVDRTLELLDRAGTPRLRVAPPYVVGSLGERREARLAVEGCAVDTDPRAPWGRAPTPPTARSCAVRVSWEGVSYPAMVDPGWMTTGSMATARFNHTASVLPSGRVLVAGGYGGTGSPVLASAELYDPSTGTWSATGSLTTARTLHTASGLPGGDVLVTGGKTTTTIVASTEIYDPTNGSWSAAASMTAPRSQHTATVLANGKTLVAGGYAYAGGNAGYQPSAELYDPVAKAWSSAGQLTLARSQHTASLLANGKVLVAGGDTSNTAGEKSAELYDPVANAWSTAPDMATQREGHTATVLVNGKVLVAGGQESFFPVNDVEIYDPANNTWSAAQHMTTAHSHHTASALATGNVLVAGGDGPNNGPSAAAVAEIYNPAGNTWAATGVMAIAQVNATASVLANGDVLVAGGGAGSFSTNAERYPEQLGANGTPCLVTAGCYSGFCVDGVCCNVACGSGVVLDNCQACSVAAGAPTNGTCVAPNGKVCDDGDACTKTDTCQAGACVGATPVVCMPLDECHVAGTCAPASGCSNPPQADGSSCTGGSCQGGACVTSASSSSSTSSTSASSSSTSASSSSSGTSSSSGGAGGATSSSGSAGGAGSEAAASSGSGGGGTSQGSGCAAAPGRVPGSAAAWLALAGLAGLRGRRRRAASA